MANKPDDGTVPLSQLANDFFDATELRSDPVGATSFTHALREPPPASSSPERMAPAPPPVRHGKLFNDPVHSAYRLDPVSLDIIDSRAFQRLRRLKQLGLTYYVFPGWVTSCEGRCQQRSGIIRFILFNFML